MRTSRILAWAALVLLVVVILAIFGQLDTNGAGPTPNGAFKACVRFASQRLKVSATSKFSSLDDPEDGESRAWLIGQHPPRFEVTAHVDSPNGSGAMLRNYLTCDVTFADGEPEWTLVELSFGEKPRAERAEEGGTDP